MFSGKSEIFLVEIVKYFLFTENLGKRLTESGHRVAVLAVDPSSGSTGGKYLLSSPLTTGI